NPLNNPILGANNLPGIPPNRVISTANTAPNITGTGSFPLNQGQPFGIANTPPNLTGTGNIPLNQAQPFGPLGSAGPAGTTVNTAGTPTPAGAGTMTTIPGTTTPVPTGTIMSGPRGPRR